MTAPCQDARPGRGLWDQLDGTELFLRNLLICESHPQTPNLSDWSGFAKYRKESKVHAKDPQSSIPLQCGTLRDATVGSGEAGSGP